MSNPFWYWNQVTNPALFSGICHPFGWALSSRFSLYSAKPTPSGDNIEPLSPSTQPVNFPSSLRFHTYIYILSLSKIFQLSVALLTWTISCLHSRSRFWKYPPFPLRRDGRRWGTLWFSCLWLPVRRSYFKSLSLRALLQALLHSAFEPSTMPWRGVLAGYMLAAGPAPDWCSMVARKR